MLEAKTRKLSPPCWLFTWKRLCTSGCCSALEVFMVCFILPKQQCTRSVWKKSLMNGTLWTCHGLCHYCVGFLVLPWEAVCSGGAGGLAGSAHACRYSGCTRATLRNSFAWVRGHCISHQLTGTIWAPEEMKAVVLMGATGKNTHRSWVTVLLPLGSRPQKQWGVFYVNKL